MPFLLELERHPAVIARSRKQAQQLAYRDLSFAQGDELPLIFPGLATRVLQLHKRQVTAQVCEYLGWEFAHPVGMVRVVHGARAAL